MKIQPIQCLKVDQIKDVTETGDSCQEGGGLRPPMLQCSICRQYDFVGKEAIEDRAE